MTIRLITADCRDALRQLPDESVHCVVTSPPYWGLRDYGTNGQIGLEPSYLDYVSTMVGIFREVRRALRDDGTLWLNLGDSYAAQGGGKQPGLYKDKRADGATWQKPRSPGALKSKDLVGIPWRVAFALQADGWYLRQDIIWSKPNPMPESVTDRCTKAHEYIFLLSKNPRYYYDQEAIKEPNAEPTGSGGWQSAQRAGNPEKYRYEYKKLGAMRDGNDMQDGYRSVVHGRNKRSVWEVTTQPFPEAHFATFPPALIEPCILAGCPKDGTVLDPFGGAGTTGLVADRLGRNAILIELNPKYAAMAKHRIYDDAPLFADVDDYNAEDDFSRSIDECYAAIRARKAAGGKGWPNDSGS